MPKRPAAAKPHGELARTAAKLRRALARERAVPAGAAWRRIAEVLERVSDAFVALDKDWRYTYVNARAGEMFGRRPEDLVGKHIWTEFPEGVGQPFHRAYERAMETQQPITIEDYYEPWRRWFENRIYPSPDGLSIYFTDVTERKRAEEARRESEERLRLFVKHAPAAIAMFDTRMRYLAVSDRWLSDYRLARENLIGRSHYEIFPEIPERWKRIHERVLAGATEIAAADPFERADGSVDWVRWEMIPWHDAAGAVGGALLCSEVITERVELLERERRAAEAAEASRRLLRELIDGLGPSLFVGLLAPDGTLLEVNRPALQAAGLAPSDVLGQHVAETYWFSYSEAVQRRLREAITRAQGGERCRYDERIRAAGDSFVTIDLSLEPLLDEAGRVRYLIPSAREITDRVRAVEELRKAETMAALGAVVAGVSHEIRNPLFAISSVLDSLEERYQDDAELRRHLAMLRRQGERLNSLVRDLLNYGRPAELERRPASLEQVVRHAVEQCESTAQERGVRIQQALPSDLPPLSIDRLRIQQVFENLIRNALEHCPSGGLASVAATLSQRTEQRFVDCVVEDVGPGIAPADLPRLFEPFFSRRRGGTGMGLAIVRRIVELHGGSVVAANRPEGGARFTVSLPVDGPTKK